MSSLANTYKGIAFAILAAGFLSSLGRETRSNEEIKLEMEERKLNIELLKAKLKKYPPQTDPNKDKE